MKELEDGERDDGEGEFDEGEEGEVSEWKKTTMGEGIEVVVVEGEEGSLYYGE